jgi:hypothetical protein
MTRHAIPATLTSSGYVSVNAPLCAGEADALTGPARYREVYARLRKTWGRWLSLRMTVKAFRHGVVLSGDLIVSSSGRRKP